MEKLFLRLLEAVAPHYNLWVYVVHYYPYILPYILHFLLPLTLLKMSTVQFYHTFWVYVVHQLPILGVCCTLTTLTFYHTFITPDLTPMSTVHFQQVETFTNPDPPIYIYTRSRRPGVSILSQVLAGGPPVRKGLSMS